MDSEKNNSSQQTQSEAGFDLESYVKVRTLIDSLECGALRYLLREQSGRGGRSDQLEQKLMPIIDWVWKQGGGGEIDCPEGYVDCQGVCVPYPCPN
jgi:hypothetical protein